MGQSVIDSFYCISELVTLSLSSPCDINMFYGTHISAGRLLHFVHICRRLHGGNDSEHDAQHETQVRHPSTLYNHTGPVQKVGIV